MSEKISPRYWLLKTEPDAYSWEDLKQAPNQTDIWDGIRNYQARNNLRRMKKGDLAFFYHSGNKWPAIMGIVRVVREAYPDPGQFDPGSPYHDAKSSPDSPRWWAVDVQLVREFANPIQREALKKIKGLENMLLLRRGNRLSVQPVSAREWKQILEISD